MVCEGLRGDVMVFAELLEVGSGEGIGRIFLCGAVLDDDAAIDDGTVHGIRVFRMVRVDAVGVVGGDHEASRDHGHGFIIAVSEGSGETLQGIRKEGGAGALRGGAANFFVIEEGVDGDVFLLLPLREAAEAGEGALQVVELRRGDEFSLFAPDGTGDAAVEDEVMREDVFGFHLGSGGDDVHERGLRAGHAIEREHVLLHFPIFMLVHAAVHMDRDGGDDEHGAVDRDELLCEVAVLRDEETSCDGEGTVEPGRHDHAAVALDIELHIRAICDFRILFDLEGRRVAVRGSDMEGFCAFFRHGEGHEGAAISGDDVLAAFLDLPGVFFADLCEACVEERCLDAADGMEGGGGLGDEMDEVAADVICGDWLFHYFLCPTFF